MVVDSGTEALDESEVPQEVRFLLVTPATYRVIKKSKDIAMETDIGHDMKIKGIIAEYDGMSVLKVTSNRVPTDCGFLIGHPMATVLPVKLAEYKIHEDPPGISGDLIDGRVYYEIMMCYLWAKNEYENSNIRELTPEEKEKVNKKLVDELEIE
ncbi:hypothetical protein [Clostridium celatum]|uniref:Uncharacterized protein n=1 Tax=Clostridium celatum DSM 1785 TaxID=545697 RepID=L1Q496_9CLOT|nr:hypothetical protein [Clostridium celatum]EKY22788.1 hypothetical protein HMPREF0216_03153 [Clostridium celatum DSM 1785]MCE9653896.1 hypothetical protein [Clostridium celatum]